MCFYGIMEAIMYTRMLDESLVPFVSDIYPVSHKFMDDKHPKHTSQHAQDYLKAKGINWWPTPAESPDINPIGNLWHELKEYFRR